MRLLFGAIWALGILACGPKRVFVDGVEMGAEDGARLLFEQGKAAQEKGELRVARGRYLEILSDFDETPTLPDALIELGAVVRMQEGCDSARSYYERFIVEFPTHPRRDEAKTALGRCATEEESNAAARQMMAKFAETKDPTERVKLAREAAQAAGSEGSKKQQLEWLLKARGEDASRRVEIDREIIELIDNELTASELGTLTDELADGFPKDVVTFKLAKLLLHTRSQSAATTFEQFLEKYPKSPYAKEARSTLESLKAKVEVELTTIGVILPLSGKWKSYGQNGVEAARLAIGELDERPDKRVKLVVKDTKGDPTEAAKAVEELVTKDGAVAIVGGLFRREAMAAANKAQSLGVPFVTLSAQENITEVGAYVFRSGLTDAAQVDALVGYVMDVLGLKTFGILHPRHPYGEVMRDLFWERVEARKGEIRAVESYGDRETTLTGPVKDLVGRSNLGARSDFQHALGECEKQPDAVRKSRCRDRVEQDIRPIIDFEGLFIPDYQDKLVLIAPALAAEDVVVETNPRYLEKIEKTMGRKVQPVRLLGASGWNFQSIPEKAGRYVENAMFTDAFFSHADHMETKRFVTLFQKTLKRDPSTEEALMFDAVALTKHVVLTFAPKSREEMRQSLRALHDYPGVTGKLSFRGSNEVNRELRILQIQNGVIREAAPPSEKAGKTP